MYWFVTSQKKKESLMTSFCVEFCVSSMYFSFTLQKTPTNVGFTDVSKTGCDVVKAFEVDTYQCLGQPAWLFEVYFVNW